MVAQKKGMSKRAMAWLQMAAVVAIALLLNFISSFLFERVDLTSDKRYTLSQPTKTLVKNLKDVVFVKVYLEGEDLPSGFRRLRDATREMLDEFRALAGDKVQYEFINPDALDAKSKKDLYSQLAAQDLLPVTVENKESDKLTEKIIIPGAMITYNNRSLPVVLLQQQLGNVSPEEVLHNSVVGLEYQIISTIHKLQVAEKPKIAIIQGHGELKPLELEDISRTLSESYQVDFVNLPQYKVGRLEPYKAIIIAKPDSFFTELEKYKIDQYIMNGGRVLWLVETLHAEMDSLQNGQAYTYDYKLNLIEDFLFKYGVRVNYDLVQDLNCHYIPLVMPFGGMQRRNLLKWPYFPVVTPESTHPVVHNLNSILFQFASTLDTINSRANPGVRKTVLLQTSPYTRVMLNPVQIDLKLVSTVQRDQDLYRQGQKNLAVLLEGTFNSNFINRRPSEETLASGEYGTFKEKSAPTKMIVISDGDVIKNQVIWSQQRALPLGFDRYTNQTFGNKNFVLNCIDYMVDESGLINVRAKDIRLRLLDNGRIQRERLYWQTLNLALPIALIILFGLIFNYVRRQRFAR